MPGSRAIPEPTAGVVDRSDMTLYRLLVVPAVLVAACVAADQPEPRTGPDDDDRAPVVVATVDPPHLDKASCTASVATFTLDNDSCIARVTVAFACDATQPQTYTWARVGLLCDGEPCAYDDVEYRCGATLARAFTYPCAAATVTGAATFDHPRTAGDVSCSSDVDAIAGSRP